MSIQGSGPIPGAPYKPPSWQRSNIHTIRDLPLSPDAVAEKTNAQLRAILTMAESGSPNLYEQLRLSKEQNKEVLEYLEQSKIRREKAKAYLKETEEFIAKFDEAKTQRLAQTNGRSQPGGNSRRNIYIYTALAVAAFALLFQFFRSFISSSRLNR
jgi:hypothetical protein